MSQASPNQPPSGGEQPPDAEALFAQAATAFVQTVRDVLDRTPLFPGDPDTRTPKGPLQGATPGSELLISQSPILTVVTLSVPETNVPEINEPNETNVPAETNVPGGANEPTETNAPTWILQVFIRTRDNTAHSGGLSLSQRSSRGGVPQQRIGSHWNMGRLASNGGFRGSEQSGDASKPRVLSPDEAYVVFAIGMRILTDNLPSTE